MLFFDVTVSSTDIDHMMTELRYAVALAKTRGYELLRLSFTEDGRQGRAIQKELRQMKQQGSIRFFLHASELFGTSAAADYFANKYAAVLQTIDRSLPYYYMIGL